MELAQLGSLTVLNLSTNALTGKRVSRYLLATCCGSRVPVINTVVCLELARGHPGAYPYSKACILPISIRTGRGHGRGGASMPFNGACFFMQDGFARRALLLMPSPSSFFGILLCPCCCWVITKDQ